MSNQEEMWCCHETFRAGKAMLTGCAEGVSDHCCHSDVASAEPCVAGMWAWIQPRSPVSPRCLPEQCNRVKPFGLRVPWSTFGTNSQPMRQRPFTLPCIPWCLHPELGGATEDGERPADIRKVEIFYRTSTIHWYDTTRIQHCKSQPKLFLMYLQTSKLKDFTLITESFGTNSSPFESITCSHYT